MSVLEALRVECTPSIQEFRFIWLCWIVMMVRKVWTKEWKGLYRIETWS